MSKHTSGPWQVKWATNVVSPDGSIIANCGGHRSNVEPRQSQLLAENAANARLIAAAPDLLEACRMALRQLEAWTTLNDEDDADRAAMDSLRAAIAKAEVEP